MRSLQRLLEILPTVNRDHVGGNALYDAGLVLAGEDAVPQQIILNMRSMINNAQVSPYFKELAYEVIQYLHRRT